jgi:PAS domain S-box-containing protein
MYRIYQVRREDHPEIYLTWARALHPADRDRAEAEVQAALDHGKQFHTEFRIIHPDGSVRTIKAAAETFRDAAGKPRRMVGLNYDITDVKQAETTLRASEEKLRALYEAEPDCLKLLEPDATLREINPAGLRILEADNPAALIGKSLLPLVPLEHLDAVRAMLAAVAGGEKRRLEFKFTGLKGTARWLEMTAVPMRDQATGRDLILGVSRDITARKHDEAALLALNARYARQEAALTTLTRSYATLPANLTAVFKEIAEVVAKTLDVERASIWRYAAGATVLVCEDLFDAKTGSHTSGLPVRAADYPVYFRTLAGAEIIVARDARQDSRTKEFGTSYFSTHGITSILETPIHSHGAMAGVVRCEHAGPLRDWTPDEQTFAVAVANLVSALLAQLERQSLEEQLRQSQKMDAFGRLAGGVAHDFNNLLTVITGHCELLLMRTAADGPTHDSLGEILKAAERAAALTSQLLAFSRQQLLAPRVVDLNLIVTDIQKMLRRLIGEDVTLVANLSPNLCPVRVDPGQMDQVIMNLTVNARDAMPNGGKIVFTTRNIDLDGARADPRPDIRPGRYVMLSVSDNGTGMTPEIQAQIFEPFFTTKGVGKGTGLGLAVVHGIIQQSGGHIDVQSAVGVGTTFTIYLPAVLERPGETMAGPSRKASRGGETLLLVEDENAVRQFATMALQQLGYTVLTAASGPEALTLLAGAAMKVDLLVTDLVMPEMGGRELAETCAARYPTLNVLYLSGYMDDEVVRRGILQADVAFLQKPFTIDSLAKKVREVLDQP